MYLRSYEISDSRIVTRLNAGPVFTGSECGLRVLLNCKDTYLAGAAFSVALTCSFSVDSGMAVSLSLRGGEVGNLAGDSNNISVIPLFPCHQPLPRHHGLVS